MIVSAIEYFAIVQFCSEEYSLPICVLNSLHSFIVAI